MAHTSGLTAEAAEITETDKGRGNDPTILLCDLCALCGEGFCPCLVAAAPCQVL